MDPHPLPTSIHAQNNNQSPPKGIKDSIRQAVSRFLSQTLPNTPVQKTLEVLLAFFRVLHKLCASSGPVDNLEGELGRQLVGVTQQHLLLDLKETLGFAPLKNNSPVKMYMNKLPDLSTIHIQILRLASQLLIRLLLLRQLSSVKTPAGSTNSLAQSKSRIIAIKKQFKKIFASGLALLEPLPPESSFSAIFIKILTNQVDDSTNLGFVDHLRQMFRKLQQEEASNILENRLAQLRQSVRKESAARLQIVSRTVNVVAKQNKIPNTIAAESAITLRQHVNEPDTDCSAQGLQQKIQLKENLNSSPLIGIRQPAALISFKSEKEQPVQTRAVNQIFGGNNKNVRRTIYGHRKSVFRSERESIGPRGRSSIRLAEDFTSQFNGSGIKFNKPQSVGVGRIPKIKVQEIDKELGMLLAPGTPEKP